MRSLNLLIVRLGREYCALLRRSMFKSHRTGEVSYNVIVNALSYDDCSLCMPPDDIYITEV